MKTIFVLTATLLSLNSLAQNTDTKFINLEPVKVVATYSYNYQPDSTNLSDIKKSDMLLFIGDHISKFDSKSDYMNDTITRKLVTFEMEQAYYKNPQRPIPAILYRIYKNYPKGMLTYTEYIPSNYFKFEEGLDMFHWIISVDTSTICGFKTQKATCNFGGRNWVAWFAPELPYNDGPYKFNGLPGLIVKVYDTRNHYVFEMKSIGKTEKSLMIDFLDTEYMPTTKQKFFQAWDSFQADIVNRARQAGGDNDFQQTLARNLSSRNNPIELIRK